MAFKVEKLIKDYTVEHIDRPNKQTCYCPTSGRQDVKRAKHNDPISRAVLWDKIRRDPCYPLSHI